ncbi:glycosyltransferase family 4 protein [Halobacillus campisalis]|uniref:Glycosyltransferase family 4 protein n=1 Tax=Halobacillus campisalis TaxID=435909 RepID=A0ABW2K9G9_9BACI|nr:glycosyltransferase family 4 protein [Halobacillus campisalis]
MVQKILFSATVDYHFKAFHLPYLKWFKEQGWDVHVAASGEIELPYVDQKYNIPIQRSPIDKKNIQAYRQFKKIIDDNQYNIIHCHTPMGGALTRLAAIKARKHGAKVIYTAHGFHFCKGAPLMNWLMYYPVEKVLAHLTDSLITINEEDYHLAQRKLKAASIELVHGVGVDSEEFKPVPYKEKIALRKSYGYRPDDFLFIYPAEFNANKNQQFLIHAFNLVKNKMPNARLLLAGEGAGLDNCKKMAKQMEIQSKVDFLGFRRDMKQLLSISDVGVGSSLREGLPVNIMEAMACELPIIAVENRGHRELIDHDVNGWLISKDEVIEFSRKMQVLANNRELIEQLGKEGRRTIVGKYNVPKVLNQKKVIYQSYMKEEGVGEWAVR